MICKKILLAGAVAIGVALSPGYAAAAMLYVVGNSASNTPNSTVY